VQYGAGIAAFQGFGCTAGDMPILTGFSSPECTPESFIGNPLGQIQALPYNDYCLPIDDLAMQLTCEQGVVTTRLFDNVNCSGTPARDMTFCNPYCDESDGSDSDSDAPPACLVESCASAGVAAVEASMQADEGILAVCEAVEVLYSSGCMRNCIGSDEVGELNVILNFCGLSPLGESSSSVPGSSPTQPPRTLSPTATPRTEVLFTQVFTELEIDAFADRAFDRQFRSDYTRSYAAAFNVEEDEVDILDIKSGSVVVRFRAPGVCRRLAGCVFLLLNSGQVAGLSTRYSVTHYAGTSHQRVVALASTSARTWILLGRFACQSPLNAR